MVQGMVAGETPAKKNMPPKVTVIVPVLNAVGTIAKCIKALLAQDYPYKCLQIIIADNGSTDGTQEIIRSFPVEMVIEPKAGSYNARNLALPRASGAIIAFTDSDCVPAPDWLSSLIPGFADPRIAGCGGKIKDFIGTSWVQSYSNRHVLRQDQSLDENTMPHPYIIGANMAYRSEVFSEIGTFDGRFISGGDTDMSWRVQQAGYHIKYVSEAVVHHFHRATVAGLYGQYFRYGIGRHCLTLKHLKKTGDHRYSYSVHRSILRTHDVFCSWLVGTWETSLSSPTAKDLFLDFIRQGAHLSGLVAGKFLYAGKL
jgi:cellulose synthase/poly-beta-1,6-N-acetylglucosamine synthase-like glycosyltransferase